jgi:hypothetical protein
VCNIHAYMYVHVLDLVSYLLMYTSCRHMIEVNGPSTSKVLTTSHRIRTVVRLWAADNDESH